VGQNNAERMKAVHLHDERDKWPEATRVFSSKPCYNNGCVPTVHYVALDNKRRSFTLAVIPTRKDGKGKGKDLSVHVKKVSRLNYLHHGAESFLRG